MVRENITKVDVQHLKRLLALKNPNVVPIWKMHNLDSHSPTVEIVSTIMATLVILYEGYVTSFKFSCKSSLNYFIEQFFKGKQRLVFETILIASTRVMGGL